MTANSRWVEKYIGIRFRDGGRDRTGLDCWGLVYVIFRDELGIELPSYGEISAYDLRAVARKIDAQSLFDPWVETPVPQDYSVVVMLRRGAPVHVGVMMASHLLHIEEASLSVLVPLTHPTVAQRKKKFFNHKQLIHAA